MLPDARAPEALSRLRRMAHFRPQACEDIPLRLGAASLDDALGGGLTAGALHDLSPAAPVHLGAATGFALALATIALGLVMAAAMGVSGLLFGRYGTLAYLAMAAMALAGGAFALLARRLSRRTLPL